MTQTPPLLAPVTDAAWPAEIADLQAGFAGALNVHRTLAHHPALLRAIVTFREHVVHATALGPQLSEVAILRAAHRMGSSYEWSQHVVRARARGLSDARIAAQAGSLDAMAPDDAVIARGVDELFADHRLSHATAAALAALVHHEGVLDLIATVSFYAMLGQVLLSFDVPLDADIDAELAARPLHDGG